MPRKRRHLSEDSQDRRKLTEVFRNSVYIRNLMITEAKVVETKTYKRHVLTTMTSFVYISTYTENFHIKLLLHKRNFFFSFDHSRKFSTPLWISVKRKYFLFKNSPYTSLLPLKIKKKIPFSNYFTINCKNILKNFFCLIFRNSEKSKTMEKLKRKRRKSFNKCDGQWKELKEP